MIKFNVGAGKRNWPGWINIDGNKAPHIFHTDVTLRFVSYNYIDLLYSSHMIGYFTRQEFTDMLAVWITKIKPGGILRLATPDFGRLATLAHCNTPLDKLIGPLFGQMKMGKKPLRERMIWHKTTYDEATLTKILSDAGFINIHRYDHRKTEHPNTGNREDLYDDHSAAHIDGVLISLNIEANKPL